MGRSSFLELLALALTETYQGRATLYPVESLLKLGVNELYYKLSDVVVHTCKLRAQEMEA